MPQWLRRLASLAAAVLLVVAAVAWWRYVFPPAPTYRLPPRFSVHRGERIMIFAPHTDDEVLGPGGLIGRAVRLGAVVRVVLVTNGDGFTLAAEDEFHSVHLTPERYIEFAYIRQRESLAALKSLGLPESAVTFLGFPDRGTAAEWEDHWPKSDPYTSPHTKFDRSPYRNSYVRNAPFAGAALAEEITRLIQEFNPDTIILPHPNDMHPDHWGTHNFVLYALATLDQADTGQPDLFRHRPRLLNYLVHRGNWPTPKGFFPCLELVPPRRLLEIGTSWGAFPLTPEETTAKHQAILKYRSQVAVMRRYLVSFARTNDLFGLLPPAPRVGGKMVDVVNDPVDDTLGREVEGAADLREIALRADRDHLYYRLTVRRPPSPFVTYQIHLHALPATPSEAPLRSDLRLRFRQSRMVAYSVLKNGRAVPDSRYPVTVEGRSLTIEFPREAAGPRRRFFVAAETYLGRPMDRTAWRFVELEREGKTP